MHNMLEKIKIFQTKGKMKNQSWLRALGII